MLFIKSYEFDSIDGCTLTRVLTDTLLGMTSRTLKRTKERSQNESSYRPYEDGFEGCGIHVNPERSFGGTNGEPPREASQLRKGRPGVSPGNFQKPTLQMVQSTLFLSYICEYY